MNARLQVLEERRLNLLRDIALDAASLAETVTAFLGGHQPGAGEEARLRQRAQKTRERYAQLQDLNAQIIQALGEGK